MLHRSLLSAAALLVAGPALAGGFSAPVVTPPVAPPPVVPTVVAPSADWSGAYAGGQLGFGRATTDLTTNELPGDADGIFEGDGALFGLHAGYMRDFGRFVLGGELDWDKSQVGLSLSDDIAFFPEGTEVGDLTSIARAKLRLGFDAGRLLPYVTAGFARASFDVNEDLEESGEVQDAYTGRFVGVGASFMASERLMVSVEALRHDFEELPANEDEALNEGFQYDTVVDTITLRGSFRF